ncbi:xenobiotic compound monooxygenase, DszA family [Hyaloscypha bicolor E]|uniref:Xenobiotic compound monooxygenase, DszA family n=1 Tax=Hyaloscypha bicolor E TaxID=1095630 RepID=A0A2J6SWM6_9HELO|nr:xenobiotic compound monooxygenase, DszA family [Hyaloscypha bicolor E]PMD55177.1 xenobiotic compound monooxygenase, DszA family [Hyaloscypha bicolor E]
MAAPRKQMQLNFFDTACTGCETDKHQRDPNDNSRGKDRLGYYTWLAKIAEKGKISSLFFADVYSPHEVYGGNGDASYRGGSQIGRMDPTILVSAMAAVTKNLCFGITGSTSYIPAYMLTRMWSTMDHVTEGRIGWNIVTSYSKPAAKAFESWEDGAQLWQAEPEMAYDPSKVHRIEFNGKYQKFSGYGQLHPSPQRTPVLFQAGSSPAGIKFSAKNAEAVFTSHPTIERLRSFVDKLRTEAKANGRDPQSIKVFTAILPIIGRTEEEAQAKLKKGLENTSWQGGLARFGGFTGVDLAKYPLDEEFDFEGKKYEVGIHSLVETFKYLSDIERWTPRKLGIAMASGGLSAMPVGTPEQVADVFEKWFVEGECDGFNMSYMSNPGSWEDVVELLVPELQKRGIYWTDYAVPGGTFRENMQGKPGHPLLPDDHPDGIRERWNP